MALIKCPECGKDVSTAANSCPHCGYPLKKGNKPKAKTTSSFQNPINSSWVLKWKKKVTKIKVVCTLIFVACVIGLVASLLLLTNDTEVVEHSWGPSYDAKNIHVVFTSIFGFLSFFTFILWLAALISCRVRTRQYDGYTILVYIGFKNILIVEDVIQDSGYINRYLYGHLPNQKQVWASISIWDGSVKMGIGYEGDEKQIL